MPQRRALQTLDPITCHQRISVNTHKAVTELVFKGLEGFIEQDFAARVTQRHVFMVSNKVDHLVDGDQLNTFSGSGTDMAARPAAGLRGRSGERGQLDAIGAVRDRKSTRLNSSH